MGKCWPSAGVKMPATQGKCLRPYEVSQGSANRGDPIVRTYSLTIDYFVESAGCSGCSAGCSVVSAGWAVESCGTSEVSAFLVQEKVNEATNTSKDNMGREMNFFI